MWLVKRRNLNRLKPEYLLIVLGSSKTWKVLKRQRQPNSGGELLYNVQAVATGRKKFKYGPECRTYCLTSVNSVNNPRFRRIFYNLYICIYTYTVFYFHFKY